MNKKKFFLQCVLCATFVFGVGNSFAEEATENEEIDLTESNSTLYTPTEPQEGEIYGSLNIVGKTIFSDPSVIHNTGGNGLVMYSERPTIVLIDNSSFTGIVTDTEGSVGKLSNETIVQGIYNSTFDGNGVIAEIVSEYDPQAQSQYGEGEAPLPTPAVANAVAMNVMPALEVTPAPEELPPKTTLSIYGGAISVLPIQMGEGGFSNFNDFWEIDNTKFKNNFIKLKGSGSSVALEADGAAFTVNNLGYEVDADGNSTNILEIYKINPDTGNLILDVDVTNLHGGITNSEFDKNSISLVATETDNASATARGGVVSAGYIRAINNTKFNANSVSTEIDSLSGSANSTVNGGTIYTAGLSELLSSSFTKNTVNQKLHGDYSAGSIIGGVASISKYNVRVIGENTFSGNTIKSSVSGRHYADALLHGGIISATADVDSIVSNTFSDNKINISATAPSGVVNAQGGLLMMHSLATLNDNTFSGNTISLSSADAINYTGGLVMSSTSLDMITNNKFLNNSAVLSAAAEYSSINVDGGIVYSDQTRYAYQNGAYTPGGWEPIPPEYEPAPEPTIPAVAASDRSIVYLGGSEFKNNSLKINSAGNNSFVNVNGAIVRSPLEIREIENSTFDENALTINATGKNAYVAVNGASVSTPSVNAIRNSKFRKNSAIISTNAENVSVDAKGGAVYADVKLGSIVDSSFEDNKIEIVSNGANPALLNAQGGALYIQGNSPITINNSNFSGNAVSVNDEVGIAQGGAIYNGSSAPLTIRDTSFENNSAKEGGAIYSNSAVFVNAINKDINFKGNTADKGGDIYINDSLLELYTSSNRTISLDGGVVLGSIAGDPELKTAGSGIVDLNGAVKYEGLGKGSINLTGNSTLNVIKDGYISDANIALTLDDNATLNVMNGVGSKIELDDLNVLSNSNSVKLDINLDGGQSDFFNLNSATPSNTGTINVSKINLLSDAADRTTLVQVSSSGHNVAVDQTLFTNKNKYIITPDDVETDKIKFYKENDGDIDGFAEAVANTSTEGTTFSALDNVTTDLTAKGNSIGNDFYIYGNNKSIDFSGKDNLAVEDSVHLTIDNVSGLTNSGSNSMSVGDNAKVDILASTTSTNVDTQLSLATENSIVDVKLSDGNSIAFSNKISGDRASKGKLNVSGGNVSFAELDGVSVAYSGPEINLNNKVTSSDLNVLNSSVNIFDTLDDVNLDTDSSVLNINSAIANSAISAKKSTINLANQSYLNSSDLLLDQSVMPIANNIIGTMDLRSVTLKGKNDISVDVDLSSLQADKINADAVTVEEGASLNIADFNILQNSTANTSLISISDDEAIRQATTTTVNQVENGLFTYGVNRQADGNYLFSISGFDPSIEIAPISQQALLTTMFNSYNYSFANMDAVMLKPFKERLAMHYGDRVAIADTNGKGYLDIHKNSPAAQYGNGPWFRPYGAIETVRLGHGPKFDNYMYGSMVGYDSDVIRSKNGFNTVISGHVAYNGSTQDYKTARVNQNGASAGLTASVFRKSFFTGLTVAGAVSLADAKTTHGTDDFTMYSVGVASKTGFNIEDEEGYFILQPNFLASYTFANTNDYTNSSGLRMKSDALNAVQLEPGLNFIFNMSDTLQTYFGGSAVFTIMGDSQFQTAGISLPRMSLDPYGQYRFGLQKRWGERNLGFAQTTFRTGGRTGAELQLGLKMAI